MSDVKVLSIQSHVVCGYVGNKSACFPLQVLGFEVDMINSVQLSNHTGYKVFKGQVLDAKDVQILFEGLKENGLHHYSHLLTGYIGSCSFFSKIVDIIKELKKSNPGLFFLCDPVMGDNGVMYVPEDILPMYKDLLPLASLITPNQFEAELLTGIKIQSRKDVIQAMISLHQEGVQIVVISSTKFKDSKDLQMFASSFLENGALSLVNIKFPELKAQFTGTGDLFAALLLAWMTKTNNNLSKSCENAVNTVHAILQKTLDYAQNHLGPDGAITPQGMELKLIQSKNIIEEPPSKFHANMEILDSAEFFNNVSSH